MTMFKHRARLGQGKLVKRFCKRIKKDFDIDLEPDTYERQYLGHWQRSHGCWEWSIQTVNGGFIGGQESMTSLLMKGKEIVLWHWDGVDREISSCDISQIKNMSEDSRYTVPIKFRKLNFKKLEGK